MSAAISRDELLRLMKTRIALDAVYEMECLADLLVEHFAEAEAEHLAFRAVALRLRELSQVVMPMLSHEDSSGEDMAVAVFGPERFWPAWVQLNPEPECAATGDAADVVGAAA